MPLGADPGDILMGIKAAGDFKGGATPFGPQHLGFRLDANNSRPSPPVRSGSRARRKCCWRFSAFLGLLGLKEPLRAPGGCGDAPAPLGTWDPGPTLHAGEQKNPPGNFKSFKSRVGITTRPNNLSLSPGPCRRCCGVSPVPPPQRSVNRVTGEHRAAAQLCSWPLLCAKSCALQAGHLFVAMRLEGLGAGIAWHK